MNAYYLSHKQKHDLHMQDSIFRTNQFDIKLHLSYNPFHNTNEKYKYIYLSNLAHQQVGMASTAKEQAGEQRVEDPRQETQWAIEIG